MIARLSFYALSLLGWIWIVAAAGAWYATEFAFWWSR